MIPCVKHSATPLPKLQRPAVERLSELRRRVGGCDVKAWRRAVSFRDPVSLLKKRRDVVNRATFKLEEMLKRFSHITPRRVMLLAEAPGGFLQCARCAWPMAEVHAMSYAAPGAIQWAFMDPAIIHNLPCHSDLLSELCEEALVCNLGASSFDLVTADGGADVEDLDAAEQASVPLALAQVSTALRLQATGGLMILKVFEGSLCVTRQLFEALRGLYDTVYLSKPYCSKACNSERYFIARGLKSTERAIEVARVLRGALETEHVVDLGIQITDSVHHAFDAMDANQSYNIECVLNCVSQDKMQPLRTVANKELGLFERLSVVR